MHSEKLRVAIVGCGNIAGPYARNLVAFPQIEPAGYTAPEPMEWAQ